MNPDLERLAVPRPAGSREKEKTRRYIKRRIDDLGLVIEERPFRAGGLAGRLFLLLLGGLLAFALLLGLFFAERMPVLGSASVIAGGILVLAVSRWPRWVEWVIIRPGRTEGINIVGRSPRAPWPPRILLVAHYDSKATRTPTPIRFALIFLVLAIYLLLAAAVLAVAIGLLPAVPPVSWGLLLFIFFLSILLGLPDAAPGPGASDNAAGVAAVLLAAETILARGLDDLGLLMTDLEEDGLIGASVFAREEDEALRKAGTTVINIDTITGPSPLNLIVSFGIPPVGSRELTRRSIAAVPHARPVWLGPGTGTDHLPFAARGIPALTILSGSLIDIVKRLHSTGDTPERIPEGSIERAAEAAAAIAGEINRVSSP